MLSNSTIENLVNSVNNDISADLNLSALTSFDKRNISLPLEKIYFVFKCGEFNSSFYQNASGVRCRKVNFEVAVNIYFSLNRKTVDVYSTIEFIFDYFCTKYGTKIQGYKIGQVKVDNDLRSFVIPCSILYEFDLQAS